MKRFGEFANIDFILVGLTLAIFLCGVIAIYSASGTKASALNINFVNRQLVWLFVGMLIIFIIINMDYKRFAAWSGLAYFISLILLVLVLILGHTRLGAQRWIEIGDFTIQPSEFAKIAFIVFFASYLANNKESLTHLKGLFIAMLIVGVPFIFILVEPDLGTSLMLIPIFFFMIYGAGAKPRHIIGIVLCGMAISPIFWHFLRDYQRQRLMVFLNPNIDPLGAGYTIIQSKIAIGSGHIFGKGWLSGTQNQLNFLPERHTDFIFSVIGEEWGFLGSVFVVFLYFLFIKRALRIVERTNDLFGRLLGVGIITALSFQIFVNISMTMGFMPVVGLPLPLISYGGSSSLVTFIEIAFLLNIRRRNSVF